MTSDDDPLTARFGPTIEALSSILRHMNAPDTAGLVCWNDEEPEKWRRGDDPQSGELCERSHVYLSRRGDGSDAWKAVCNTAWAVNLWEVITNPEPGTPQNDLLALAISLGMIIRELEELGLAGEDGLTIAELTEKGRAGIAQQDRARRMRSTKNKEEFKPLSDLIKKFLLEWKEEKGTRGSGPTAAMFAIEHHNKKIKRAHRGKKYTGNSYDLWKRFKKYYPDWLSEHRPDLQK